MRTLFVFTLLIISVSIQAQNIQVDIDKLIEDTQISTGGDNEVKIVWWIPVEFWETVLSNDPSMNSDQAEQMMKVLRPYVIFAVVDGKIGPFGGITYTPFDDIKKSINLKSALGKSYEPLDNESLNPDAQILMSSFKPILKNILGAMGENMHFFVFSDVTEDGDRIADPLSTDKVKFEVLGKEYSWRTPLGSLMAPKFCPEDNAELSGAWNYCPWHGSELVLKKD